jgi:UDPglucose 6-dehydrogenase
MSRIAIIGTGYVGLTTGACMAHLGHQVICADVDTNKVEQLQAGVVPILEYRLDELVAEGLANGRLTFTSDSSLAVSDAEVVFLCVPTPQGDDGSADLSYVQAAATTIAAALPHECIVVNKSTVPVGSTKVVERAIRRSDVRVVSNPEFLREGSAVDDFLHPDRVVVGCDDPVAARAVGALYDAVRPQLIITDPASAELIKYAANALLATKLSFVNAIATICEEVGADIDDVVVGLGYDTRIGPGFLRPGPGWGGSCFPKDTRALARIAEDAGYDFGLLRSVIEANLQQFDHITSKIRTAAGGSLSGATVAIWGLTFKARTDDLRDSPALEVAQRLLREGAIVQAFDPTVPEHRTGVPETVRLADGAVGATSGATVLAVLTEWDEFKWIDPTEVAAAMPGRHVVDGRNILDRAQWQRNGFHVASTGRSS